MLTHITLMNFALADHLELELNQGFNVLTGETGAGKSLLLDALSICLGERSDTAQVRYGQDKAEVIASFSYQADSPEGLWLKENELFEDTEELIIRRVIFATGRSKAWINGRPTSISELRTLGRLLVLMYSQHSQQQLLNPPYPKQWLDRYSGLQSQAQILKQSYQTWQKIERQYQHALEAQHSRAAKIEQLQQQLEDLEPLLALNYQDIEQEYDRLSHHESMMQDCSSMLYAMDDGEQNILGELNSIVRRAETQQGRSKHLEQVYNSLLNAQSELQDATSELRQFIDRQNFDPERMEELNQQLEQFHRLARKHRLQPHELLNEYQIWQNQLEQLHELENPEHLAEQAEQAHAHFIALARQLDQARQEIAIPTAQQLTEQVKPLALPEAHFEFKFESLDSPTIDGLSNIQLLFTANKGIPAQPLARVASGGELSRIALVMQVMNATRTDAEVLVFDEIDVGISGGTAEIVGRLLANLAQHVQILCITHQAQVAAQSDQHLLVKKQQTDPASSTIIILDEQQRIYELARMSGGVEINETTLQHAKQLRELKFQHTKS
ncbi:DNA repair protein RecN [Acinetobacter qingfengensis]|uniref:DNA repair protein RecN n=1 Tax=Acinetobacter qingfengensis TaxID=1262585 RepID=A0A1E7RDS5_9GAMM|nr:DNA repair protein RecN [Acinetobacter qingfengensis]KAA8733696.1 DNA repair protein RecN [Acinetobacter qingfengensis]OEY97488.1 DNA repair protein RecN [Acinetobacter qingfengensis]